MTVWELISLERNAEFGRVAPSHPYPKFHGSNLQDETIGDSQNANDPRSCSTQRAVNEGTTRRIGKLDEDTRTARLQRGPLRPPIDHRMIWHLRPDQSVCIFEVAARENRENHR